MWAATPKLVFVAALAINCILWSHSRYAQVGSRSPFHSGLAKRSLSDADRSTFLWFSADEVSLSTISCACACAMRYAAEPIHAALERRARTRTYLQCSFDAAYVDPTPFR